MSENNNIDLVRAAQHFNVTLSPKSCETPEDARLRRFKEMCLFGATMAAITCVLFVCVFIILFKPQSAYTGIAFNGLISLTSALTGYYVRGKIH